MFTATRRWFRRNRTPLAVGVGVLGAGYVATQYLLAKINDARERMSSDRIAKENLRRRFEQNQEDCTFTVLALLPTVTANLLDTMNTEGITYQIQHMKAAAAGVAKSVHSENGSPPSIADTLNTEDDTRSMVTASMQSDSGIHASQVSLVGETADSTEGSTVTPAPPPKRKTKRQLWDELTISSITRAYTLLYTVSLLIMLTRIQLNLLGRRSYLSSVVSLATGNAQATISLENNDDDNPQHVLGGSYFEVNRKYLAFSWWLLNRSWEDIMHRVEDAVRAVFGHLSPRDFVSLESFAELTRQVRQTVEHAPIATPTPASPSASYSFLPLHGSRPAPPAATPSRWLPLVLPPPGLEDYVLRESGILADSAADAYEQIHHGGAAGTETGAKAASAAPAPDSPAERAALRRLLDETADLVDSPTFSRVLTQILDAGFATLLEHKVAPGAFDLPPSAGEGSAELVRLRSQKTVQLPKVLSVLTRQAHVLGSGMPNEYLQEMEAVRDLEAFAAVVYSSNWEREIQEDGLAAAAAAAAAATAAAESETEAAALAAVEAAEETDATMTDIDVRPRQIGVVPTSTAASVVSSTEPTPSMQTALSVQESVVMVDTSVNTLESAWGRAVDKP